MPTISGSLNLVTNRPVDSISEVWVRARETRGQGDGLVVGVNDRVPVTDGAVEFTALPGASVLVLVQNGMPLETLPMLVGDEAQQSLRLVVQAGEVAGSADKRVIEQLAAEIAANAARAEQYRTEAASSASSAQASETAASESASNAKTSETNAKTSETNAKTSETNAASSAATAEAQQEAAGEHLNNAVAEAGKAADSAAAAKTSETNAASSASASASSASSSATQADLSAASATQAATHRDAAEISADAAAGSAAAAKTSENNAEQSESNAGDYAAVATTAATEAVGAMEAASNVVSSIDDSVNTAAGHADRAGQHETGAATYAQNASDAADRVGTAEQVGNWALEARDARDDAETARDAAETARDTSVTNAEQTAQDRAHVDQVKAYVDDAAETISKAYATSVSVKEFGAVGDGIADDTDALNAALSTGFPVELHDGETYRITSTISHVGDVTLFCRGNATITQTGQGFTGLHFQGESVSSSQLSAGKEIGDRVWRVASTSGITAGMLMEVISDKSWYYDPRPDATDARKSELHRVQHVEAGVIHTELEANDGYPASESVTVNFYQPATVLIENVTIEAKLITNGATVRRGVLLETVSDSILRNVTVRNYGLTGVSARRAYNSKILGGAMENINGAGASYAMQTSGSTLFDIVGTRFTGCYAGVDFSGTQVISLLCSVSETVVTGGGIDSKGEQFGWKEFSAMGDTQRAHGTHGPSDRCRFFGNRISGVHSAFVLRGRNHIVSENQIESRSANGMIRIYDGYNFTISDNVCDRSFFGGKDTTSQSWSSPQDKLPETFVLVYSTYVTDGNAPLVIRGNKVQVRKSVVRLQGATRPSAFVLSYESNTATLAPKDKSSGVFLVDCTSPQSISNRSSISVGDVKFAEYNTEFALFPDSMSVWTGAKIFDYSVNGSSYLEVVGGIGQEGARVSSCRIVFHGAMATIAFRLAGVNVTREVGSIFTIRMKPYLYGGSGSSASLSIGNCSSLAASGTVGHFTDSTAGEAIMATMRSTDDNHSVITGVATYPVGSE